MGDVKLAAQTHVSKTSLTVDHSRVSSMPLTEAPAFTLPPRNLCIKEGATAKFEGRRVLLISVLLPFASKYWSLAHTGRPFLPLQTDNDISLSILY
ncbi:hypothetical protein FD755_014013 [Muntiacus reevesi]|uniref:Uncharacterized protein n=1 Tax=Muntiacus reevesi TaxID=9886 RepID=A0A5N3XKL3_MUNRE|nr:hypothetical protein FD755_014013 [Muntiacus reevesi]